MKPTRHVTGPDHRLVKIQIPREDQILRSVNLYPLNDQLGNG